MPPQTKGVNVDDVRNRDVAIVTDGVSVEVPFPTTTTTTTIPEAHEPQREEEEEPEQDKLGYAPAAPDTNVEDAQPEPVFSLFTGMKHDLLARQPYYNCRTSCFDETMTNKEIDPKVRRGCSVYTSFICLCVCFV